MLKSIAIKNLTVFSEASLLFSPQLNVVVGENGAGKSHLLKAMYAVLAASAEEGRKPGEFGGHNTYFDSIQVVKRGRVHSLYLRLFIPLKSAGRSLLTRQAIIQKRSMSHDNNRFNACGGF
jgi:recombinational DNA repair ATPase RecF